MHLHAVYSPLFFRHNLGCGNKGRRHGLHSRGRPGLAVFKHMNGSEKIKGNTLQCGSGQYNTKVLSECESLGLGVLIKQEMENAHVLIT